MGRVKANPFTDRNFTKSAPLPPHPQPTRSHNAKTPIGRSAHAVLGAGGKVQAITFSSFLLCIEELIP